jgi:hypothetical protein
VPCAGLGPLFDRRVIAFARPLAALAALALLTGATAMDKDNPTCPAEPDFGPGPR